MIQSLSDKALLEMARHGDTHAAAVLARRFGRKEVSDYALLLSRLRSLKTLSVTAAKRVIHAT